LSEGQESDSDFAIPVLSQVNIDSSDVLADKGYDSDNIIDFIYDNNSGLTISSKINRTFQRRYD
jgi:hypothetical protein